MGERRPVTSRTTAWSPRVEQIHKTARRKFAESKDLQRIDHADLAEPTTTSLEAPR